jgi:hypothetical protein
MLIYQSFFSHNSDFCQKAGKSLILSPYITLNNISCQPVFNKKPLFYKGFLF